MKIKYLILAVLFKKQTKVTDIETKLNNHNHDKYITTLEFNTLAKDLFNVRLAQANLITKIDFNAKLSRINREITKNQKEIYLLKMNWII